MTTITLTRSDPAKNLHRFYALDVQPDLFGASCLICEWGRIGRNGSQMHSTPYPTLDAAKAALERQCQAKERRGYITNDG